MLSRVLQSLLYVDSLKNLFLAADDCAFNCDCGESGLCELTSDFDYGYETALCNTTGQYCSTDKQVACSALQLARLCA